MVLRARHIIDLFKVTTLPFCLWLMWWYEASENTTMWIYTAMHGSYGILWATKSFYYGDKNWEVEQSVPKAFLTAFALCLYWIAPYSIVTNNTHHHGFYLCVSVFIYAVGVFLHFASDMQKHITLKLKPQLITTGLFTYSRNPNYLGELLIYSSFNIIALDWRSVTCFMLMILCVWVPNMKNKDKSLSRYKEWEDYKAQSGLIFPTNFF